MESSADAAVKRYAGRRKDSTVLNMTIDTEAVEVLRQYCPPGRRVTGRFVARLIYEFDVRQQERQQLRAQLAAVLEEARDER